jgi:aminopeptidase N
MRKVFSYYFLFLLYPFVSANDGYHRYLNTDVLHYEFGLTINDSTNRIEGQAVIIIKILDKTDSVSLDLKGLNNEGKGMSVAGVSLNSEKVKWKHVDERLIVFLNKCATREDTLEFAIKYSGIPADGLIISMNKYGDRTFFADHWPDRAHNYLPCIDHPYDKASVDFIITAPNKYSVVANGILVEESVLDGNLKLTHWSEIVPLPVKVMAFGVARFAVRYTADVNNISVWSWVFPQNSSEGFNDYSVAVRPLDYYIRIIGKYPYKKLANVQSQTIYGGLENAGTIFYSENSVTGLGKAERLIAHEIAHQWFGNCVTEADWHHVWLSEGFATYLTSLYFESQEGAEIIKSDMTSARTSIIEDYLKNPKPVIDTTITNLIDLLSVNSYQKGAWVLHMLRHDVGDKDFMEGLKLYYDRYYDSNTLSSDFQHVMEEASGKDLSRFFQQWLYTAGHPELKIWHKTIRKTGTTEVFIEQEQDYLFEFSLGLLIKDTSGEKNVTVDVKERVTKIVIPSMNDLEIVPDPDVNLLFRQVDSN